MIGGSISDLDRCSFLHPLFSRLIDFQHLTDIEAWIDRRAESSPGIGSNQVVASDQLTQDKADDIRRLPKAGVEEVRQTVGGEIGEAFGTIKGIVDSAATPPLGFQDVDGVKLLGIHNTGDDAFFRRPSLMMMMVMT